ncbi:LytTR family DNA-binding domain-containing protein [Rhodanobacter sp. DHB23]|uniref:LytR/AlgR family response regulator transcription factor n=1 Tax=Rhodanobacter sp. DHB23 TaxID=2775923 RepID=UPI00177DAA17|nr:LytTR family DNA-binding domain-containing protein [Rhodanobacter sp. DHB23]MBD8872604.1 response regulator transcription factor [Rhodanobacter sp. DHB23]
MTRAVIAEDEPLLREALSRLLGEAWPELDVIAECENGADALDAIAAQQPDVAFLDIRMPGLSGLEVAAAAAEASPATQVVFTTAYDQYAVDAFERGAIDYLLKPVTIERLAATVERLKRRAAAGQAARGDLALLLRELAQGAAQTGAAPLTWITAGTGRETRLIMVDDVAYFRADHKYTVAMTADGEALLRKPIRELLEQLDPAVFKQIHRSTIVNLKAIASIVRDDSGKGTVRLRQRPETLTVSQPFMALFRNM